MSVTFAVFQFDKSRLFRLEQSENIRIMLVTLDVSISSMPGISVKAVHPEKMLYISVTSEVSIPSREILVNVVFPLKIIGAAFAEFVVSSFFSFTSSVFAHQYIVPFSAQP